MERRSRADLAVEHTVERHTSGQAEGCLAGRAMDLIEQRKPRFLEHQLKGSRDVGVAAAGRGPALKV